MAESKKCRQYSVEYLKFGFLPSKADKRLPTCLLCNKVLSNDSMKPSKLEDHLRRCHPDKIGKDLKYFQTLKEKYEKRPTVHSMFSSTSESNDDGLRASYNISLLIAKSGQPHIIGEQLILPAVEEVECLDEDIQTYVQHLIALHDDFKFRFEDILSMEIPPWIINPFDETVMENVILQEELLELSTNEELKVTFKRGYQKFWLQAEIPKKYPGLWEIVEKLLIAFPSSYLVEKSFSTETGRPRRTAARPRGVQVSVFYSVDRNVSHETHAANRPSVYPFAYPFITLNVTDESSAELFLCEAEAVDDTRRDFSNAIQELNEKKFDLDSDYEPNYKAWISLEELFARIKPLRRHTIAVRVYRRCSCRNRPSRLHRIRRPCLRKNPVLHRSKRRRRENRTSLTYCTLNVDRASPAPAHDGSTAVVGGNVTTSHTSIRGDAAKLQGRYRNHSNQFTAHYDYHSLRRGSSGTEFCSCVSVPAYATQNAVATRSASAQTIQWNRFIAER
ncbi:Protein FAM200B [Eumeta japonica]|uniref:Protein FAM200B n=1 Tax=Eumeta variegata TaxID=151549 RepID=A0A4C1WNX5_EUMVA|nr:Protein FAM200B [Eumeta japonica]